MRRIKIAVFMLTGGIAWLAGVTHVTLIRSANPFDLVSKDFNVLAAVVLGKGRITGGHGAVSATVIGVLVITMINSSLLLIRVPTYRQRLMVGMVVLVGTGLPMAIERISTLRMRQQTDVLISAREKTA